MLPIILEQVSEVMYEQARSAKKIEQSITSLAETVEKTFSGL